MGLRNDGWDLIISGETKHPISKDPYFNNDRHAAFGGKLFAEDVDFDGYLDLIVGSPSASTGYFQHQVRTILM